MIIGDDDDVHALNEYDRTKNCLNCEGYNKYGCSNNAYVNYLNDPLCTWKKIIEGDLEKIIDGRYEEDHHCIMFGLLPVIMAEDE